MSSAMVHSPNSKPFCKDSWNVKQRARVVQQQSSFYLAGLKNLFTNYSWHNQTFGVLFVDGQQALPFLLLRSRLDREEGVGLWEQRVGQ